MNRIISCVVGGTLLVGGLFMYGFTAVKVHFMVVSYSPTLRAFFYQLTSFQPLVAVVILTAGAANVMLAVQLYSIDG